MPADKKPKNQTPADKQRETNRANSLNSTGPTSEAGKESSSRNALKHGLTATVANLPADDREAIAALTQDFLDRLQPDGPVELQLAIALAEHQWRLNQIRAIEAGIYSAAELSKAEIFLTRSRELDRLTVYEQRIRRAYEKDFSQLKQLQAERKAAYEAAREEAIQRHEIREFLNVDLPEHREVNGFVFSTEDLKEESDRRDDLKRFAWHEARSWSSQLSYPDTRFYNEAA